MYRGERNTGKWFENDRQPQIKDREVTKEIGPGKYDTDNGMRQTNYNQQISWNVRNIPFGGGDQRFKKNYREYFRPGPASYDPKDLTALRIGQYNAQQSILFEQGSKQSHNSFDLSPRRKELLTMNMTLPFKSKAPKTGIYDKDEKRVKLLYGPKPNLKYQIKLNDQILDKQDKYRLTSFQDRGYGKLILGSNFSEDRQKVPAKLVQRNKDLFGLQKMNPLGPQDYDPPIQGKNIKNVIIKEPTALPQGTGSVKKQMETYLGKLFDEDANKIKQSINENYSCVSLKQSFGFKPKTLEEIHPFVVDKRDTIFKSKINRDPLGPSKNSLSIPNPGVYENQKPKGDLTQSKNYIQFGSSTKRNDLMQRDVSKSPFCDPTKSKSPPPNMYQPNEQLQKKKQSILQSVGSNLGINQEVKMTNSFYSPVKRDFMDQVSKEQRANPGPGSYDTNLNYYIFH